MSFQPASVVELELAVPSVLLRSTGFPSAFAA